MYQLFKLTKDRFVPLAPLGGTEAVVQERVTAANCGFVQALYWNLVSRGKCRIYIVQKNGKTIHSSLVVPKCCKFPFLDKQDIEIGPCSTAAEERGKGIYPRVLSEILRNHLDQGDAYMIVDEENSDSLRGIAKVGFCCVGHVKKDGLKRYVVA